ncbi:MAG: TonB-dependent receptor [Arenimonas sp.]|nr:TonB-dependent receptor [Arenimonas sp.]
MSNFNQLSGAIRFALLAGAASAFVTLPAFAQESTESEAATLDTVEVTGSRLKRAEIEGAVPVVVIDRAQIDASGDVSVADLLRDTTFASFGNFRPQSGSSAQSLASIDLRGLGSGRTLVLIDGRRAPTAPQAASSGSDLNAIPLAAVERIEILSDGASAVYGSDAIGGVVNVITRRDFNGAELRIGRGNTEVTGGDLEDMSFVFGSASDTTRIVGGASSSKRGMVFTRDQIGYTLGVSSFGNNYVNALGVLAPVPGFACNQGAFYTLGNGLCSFDFNSVAANEASIDSTSVFLRADHQINDSWNIYSAANVTQVESFGRYAPVPGIVTAAEGGPGDIVVGNGAPTIYRHRFAAGGNRDNFTDTTNSDFLLGVQGQLTDTIGLDVGIRHSDYKYAEVGRGYVISSLANAAVNAGLYDLRNPFGASQDVLNSFTATIGRTSRWQTDEMYAIANFDVFEMGGGTSNAVVGAEYRDDTFQDIYDSLSEAGVVLGSAGNSSAGDRQASAVFFEWLLPFTSSFDITLAGRFDDYSDVGNSFSPKVAFRWQPLDNLTFRGSYGEGFRAPGLDILTQKPTFSAEPVNDPQSCVALSAAPTCSLQVDTFFIANPDLAPEESEQYSVGFVYDPFEWLDLSVDYYNIKVNNTIGQISAQDIINSDLDPATYGPLPPGVAITRAPNGAIIDILAGYANQGTLTTDGVDLRVGTEFDLADYGSLNNQLTVSWINSYEIDNGRGSAIEYIDLVGYPEYRATLLNSWTYGDFTFGWNVNYIGGQEDTVGGYATNDVQMTWKAPWNGTIAVGATNVGDRYPELVGFDGRPWNFYLYDAYGRTTYLRYTQTF